MSNEPFLTVRRTADDNVMTKVKLVFDDPFAFGMVLVDAARTIARAFGTEEGAMRDGDYLDRIKEGFDAEWDRPTTDIQMKADEPQG